MKVIQINATCGAGSTGKICVEISKLLTEKGIENYIFYFEGESEYPLGKKVTTDYYIKSQALLSRSLGNYGFNSKGATKRLIEEIKKINPDIIHLHNIHCHGCNFNLLFEYLKATDIKILWTFHDCWAFTGYCMYFDMVDCNKWECCCNNCPQKDKYSWFFDKSENLYEKKKNILQDLNLTIVTPSKWLADVVKKSFLKNYPIKVINNGIDLSLFEPTESNFKENNGIADKYMLLGVSFDWDTRKGLDVFVELSKQLSEKYQIVLVGVNEAAKKQLPENIIAIGRTKNQKELAEIYSAADVFVNPTKEENFPTVNIESLACGTPIVSYETGGSSEIFDEASGVAVPKNDIDKLKQEIISVCENKRFTKENCIKRAQNLNSKDKFNEYIVLYEQLLK
jgi:glycosyltransferase involved in cell wall biosynthesis